MSAGQRTESDLQGLPLLIGVACAILFHRAALYERMSPWAWTLTSLAITAICFLTGRGNGVLILAQALLFGVMWWYNAQRLGRK